MFFSDNNKIKLDFLTKNLVTIKRQDWEKDEKL